MKYEPDLTTLNNIAMPALLGFARKSYGWEMRKALKEVGCDDVPRHGMYLLSAVARNGSKNADVVQQLGLSKQSASQLVDTMVLRGYIARTPDADDRRRMNLSLTERGEGAVEAMRTTRKRVDARIEEMVGTEYLEHTRVTLAALIDMNEARHETTSAE